MIPNEKLQIEQRGWHHSEQTTWVASAVIESVKKKSKMEYQPNEILDFMFRQFENLTNLRKCYNACFKWKTIIDGILKDSSIVFL